MRYLTLTIFLAAILGFAGCSDADNAGGEAGDGAGAMDEMSTDEGAMDEGSMEEMSMEESGTPQWATLEQNVVHSE